MTQKKVPQTLQELAAAAGIQAHKITFVFKANFVSAIVKYRGKEHAASGPTQEEALQNAISRMEVNNQTC